jgi:HEPN domain-containing protein
MSGPDPADGDDIRREAARWLAVAADDRRIAEACLGLDPPALGGSAYHCQQAAEKIVKGLLVAAAIPFRKTHDMVELADLALVPYPELRTLLDAIRRFTLWGVAYRYPALEDIPEPMPGEADLRSAIAIISALAERLRSLASSEGRAQP